MLSRAPSMILLSLAPLAAALPLLQGSPAAVPARGPAVSTPASASIAQSAPTRGAGQRGGATGTRRGTDARESERAPAPAPQRRERPVTRVVDTSTVLAGEDQILAWFNDSDWDENGWISFREARKSLAFDRERYGAYDDDDDGRLALREFREYYFYNFRNVGGFIPPRTPPTKKSPPRRSPEQLRNAYDRNLDGKLSLRELKRMLDDYGRDKNLATDQVLRALDANRDQRLETNELRGVTALLRPLALESEATEEPTVVVESTVEELFGQRTPRGTSPGATPYPPLIVGPVPHYRRLDVDDDGRVTPGDLETLLRPVQIPIRIQTVFNTLDKDGNGNLDRSEFRRALSDLE